jgi:16S rRNA (guanine1207-N2)-methyltransferase
VVVSTDDQEHYFSASPAGDFAPTEISVRLAGRELVAETAGGIFSPEHVDAGTEALLRIVPEAPATGDLLDLGCGWGPIALTMAIEAPAARVWAVDVNERAIELTRRNAVRADCVNITASKPTEVPADLRFGAIWSNPPIRVGKAELHAMLEMWLPRLVPGGEAYLVVAKHLGADSLLAWMTSRFADTHVVTKGDHYKGFRVIEVRAN